MIHIGVLFFNYFDLLEIMLFSMLKEKLHKIIPHQNGMTGDLYGLQFGSNNSDRSIRKIIVCLDPTLNIIMQTHKL